MTTPAWAGIDPISRRVCVIGVDSADTLEEIRRCGYIAVPCTTDMARFHLDAGRPVNDLYALADRGRTLQEPATS